MTLGDNIVKMRTVKSLSREELAEKLSVSVDTVTLWENGQATPTIEHLILLKEIFGVQIDDLLCATETGAAINKDSLDTVCAALAYAMGIDAPHFAAHKNDALASYVDEAFGGEKADRIVIFGKTVRLRRRSSI